MFDWDDMKWNLDNVEELTRRNLMDNIESNVEIVNIEGIALTSDDNSLFAAYQFK